MKKQLRSMMLIVGLIAVPYALHADDTDIYINRAPPDGARPKVMFTLDIRPNVGSSICQGANCKPYFDYFRAQDDDLVDAELAGLTALDFFDLLRLSLLVVMGNKDLKEVEVGLLLPHNAENDNACKKELKDNPNPRCSSGGAIIRGFRPLSVNGSREEIGASLKKATRLIVDGGGNINHPYQGSAMFFEFYRYLTGRDIVTGHYGAIDFEKGNSADRNTNMNAYAPASWDSRIESGTRYISPFSAGDECSKVYSMTFFGADIDGNAPVALIEASPASGGMGINQKLPKDDHFASVINFLHNSTTLGNHKVQSYFFVRTNGEFNSALAMAEAGGTENPKIIDTSNPGQLVDEITATFREILATSTTFVAASVPVNVFNRASIINNVYIALFQAAAEPYWTGNVKKLQIDSSTTNIPRLVDALGQDAVINEGRIRFDALTFWTDPTLLTDSDPDQNLFAGRDGRHVARGGAGQQIPGFATNDPGVTNSLGKRTLFYLDTATAAPALRALEATSTLAANTDVLAQLGPIAAPKTALQLLQYIRGYDLQAADANGDGVPDRARKWIMGDPLHSRPLPVNYGALSGYSKTNPAIFIAVGSNDGFMRLIRNTKQSNAGQSGQEAWAFIPPEGMKVQTRLEKNNADSTDRHPYSVDGIPTVLMNDVDQDGTIDAGDSVTLFFGLRRGGNAYYALDVTNPEQPQFKWRVTSASPDFSELGQSFSTPRVGVIEHVGSECSPAASPCALPVLIFGGGFDTNKDFDGFGSNDAKGRAIFVVNAATGSLIWKAVPGSTGPDTSDERIFRHSGLTDSIPSDLAIADTDGDGITDRVLVGDTGGKVWRVDFTRGATPSDNRRNWKLTLLANLGRHYSNNRLNDRRFFHEPDIVPFKDPDGRRYDAVVIGSGDRENPLDYGGAPDNYFYMIKDRNTGVGSASDSTLTHDGLGDITSGCLLTTCAPGPEPSLANGWKLRLADVGEKSLSAPVTVGGRVFFTTYVPTGTDRSCAPSEGIGFAYAVALSNGNPVFANYDDNDSQLAVTDRREQLKSAGIPAQVVFVPGMPANRNILRPDLTFTEAPTSARFRTFWQRVQE